MLSLGAVSSACVAPGAIADSASASDEIVVIGRYEVDGLSDAKHALPALDSPQTFAIVPDQLLEEQGRRTLRDSLRNVTGISIQAGEGNPPGGGDALSIRGFSARDDIYVDGTRDIGNYFRDPFNADRIEVTKGPASAFAGRGNVGGTVNVVSRAPKLRDVSSAELSIGTDELNRATVDWNFVVDEARGIAVRLNGMGHRSEEPGRDVVESERWGFAPSIAFGLGSDTAFTLGYFHQEQDDVPDFGLPNARNASLAGSGFEGRVAPVDAGNYYGYSTDYRDVEVDRVTGVLEHRFSESASIRSLLRWAETHNDSIMSAPRFVGTVATLDATTEAVGNRKPRDQKDEILVSQTDLTLRFATGRIAHTFVAGLEYTDESSENRRRLDANGPNMNLFVPTLQPAPEIAYNGTRARLDVDTLSLYVFDTLEIGERWRLVGGLRYDDVETRVRGFDDAGVAPGFVTDLEASDEELSGNLAVVYKPSVVTSVYLAFGTAFEPSGRSEIVQLAGASDSPPVTPESFFVDPELSQSWEAGFKWDALGGRLALASAVFEIERTDARTPGVNPGDPPVVLDGEQRVRGAELSAVGTVYPGLDVFAGYTWLDGEVTKSNNPFEVGQTTDNTPEHSATVWLAWTPLAALTIGGGVQYVGERTSNVRSAPDQNFVITQDDYTVFDAFVEYAVTESARIRLNGYNLGDEEYFQSFSSGQSIPAAGTSAVLSLTLDF
jgi:catecholate siderophore receptor